MSYIANILSVIGFIMLTIVNINHPTTLNTIFLGIGATIWICLSAGWQYLYRKSRDRKF